MPKQAILHLSDLHLSSFSSNRGGKVVSWLDTKNHYIDEFIKSTNKKLTDLDAKINKIIITGDLANTGVRSEYAFVKSALEQIMRGLDLAVTDLIIVPGNHDISWSANQIAYEDKIVADCTIKADQLHEDKFRYFQEFYHDFYKENFTLTKPKLDPLTIDGKQLLFIGINSCHKESFETHQGYIDLLQINGIREELEGTYKEFYKVAIFHHNIPLDVIDKSIVNWNTIKSTFYELGIRTFICGHIHTNGVQDVQTDYNEYCVSAVGSFAKKDVEISNTYNLYVFEKGDEDGLHFEVVRMRFSSDTGGHYGQGLWDTDTTGNKRKLLVRKDTARRSIEIQESTILDSTKIASPLAESYTPLGSFDDSQDIDYSAKLIEIVRDKQAIVSGHFHWSDNSRSHNWIDTGKLLTDADALDLVAKALFQNINKNNIQFEGVIGIGMEGNMLGALIAAAENKPYTYIPVPNRKDYNKYEIEANLRKKCEKILLVVDVLSTGCSLKDILENESYRYIRSAAEINILSLFFTGEEGKLQVIKDEYANLRFYSVCSTIRFGYCNEEDPHKCPVFEHKLATVHEFYTKE